MVEKKFYRESAASMEAKRWGTVSTDSTLDYY